MLRNYKKINLELHRITSQNAGMIRRVRKCTCACLYTTGWSRKLLLETTTLILQTHQQMRHYLFIKNFLYRVSGRSKGKIFFRHPVYFTKCCSSVSTLFN